MERIVNEDCDHNVEDAVEETVVCVVCGGTTDVK